LSSPFLLSEGRRPGRHRLAIRLLTSPKTELVVHPQGSAGAS